MIRSNKLALIFPGLDEQRTFSQLEERSDQIAAWLLSLGLQEGDGIALLMENRPELLEIAKAATKVGLYYTPMSTHLASEEVEHILFDSRSSLLIVTDKTVERAQALKDKADFDFRCVTLDAATGDFQSFVDAVERTPQQFEFPQRAVGREMLYSSGTTGKPKGIRRELVPHDRRHEPEPGSDLWRRAFGINADSVYLCPAPLYHAAPLRYTMRALDLGATCVVLSGFDAQDSLAVIERYKVTHSQWVPTMFVRMLELPDRVRTQYDLSSMQVAVHAAAPCPVHVKEAMLDWWGEIIHEYYAGSESAGTTWITPPEWRAHPGSVGRPLSGQLHIVDEDNQPLGAGEIGRVYFGGGAPFAYWNDPLKTQSAMNAQGWVTYGDIGYVDEEGYLYLSDRRDDLILSGGVNIYPFEIESVLTQHEGVEDAAVVGVPHPVFGEQIKAIVQLRSEVTPDEETAQALVAFLSDRIARIKLPKSIVFEIELPRLETGKLLRRVLKEKYKEQPEAGFHVSAPR